MRTVPQWGEYFLGLAEQAARRSKDPNTNVGAVLVGRDRRVLSIGYNGFPSGVKETTTRWESENKANFVVHAELNALLTAAKNGVALSDSACYVTLAPCLHCALQLISVGVKAVITPAAAINARLEARPELIASHQLMRQVLSEAGVMYHEV